MFYIVFMPVAAEASPEKRYPVNPTSPEAYTFLWEETIFGANIAVRRGLMTPWKAQELVEQARIAIETARALGLPVETDSHQTGELEREWRKIRNTQKAA